ncbi:EcsC family protein [Salipiger mucosus]|uniref:STAPHYLOLYTIC protease PREPROENZYME LASA n=1 Tax=Salipiger mucosus DSM 16094 TaxID=1123237 RepID=S9QBH3_9RHOB|nr:EcsC family protein [Salipiger mucosus]EPX78766.1 STAPHYLOLYTIC protease PREPROENZYME LASA [Salipiger mucosus DSM 16094]
MTGSQSVAVTKPFDEHITALARQHRAAGGVGLQVLNIVGGQAENLLERLPDRVKDQLEQATERALRLAMQAAAGSRGVVPDQKGWFNTTLTTAMGAAGGAGGLPTALAELPLTTTWLLRAIQGIAAEHGFDPNDPEVRKECLLVFGAAGPLEADDGADMAFFSARLTLTGATVHGLISRVAPRLATVLGQKLAAQTVPVIGAAAGAATNYAYTSYYQQMAHVHFGLRRLEIDSGRPREELVEALRHEIRRLG